ncbi:hypothetical protein J6590_048027 [Homalodisca vitripennis]|nr:hypothetical protein J6590_048027 [Homalodisca vitripennis]
MFLITRNTHRVAAAALIHQCGCTYKQFRWRTRGNSPSPALKKTRRESKLFKSLIKLANDQGKQYFVFRTNRVSAPSGGLLN